MTPQQQIIARPPEPNVVGALARSEIDGQIATARQFPRNVEQYHARALALATRSEEVAAECLYSLPRDNKIIEGPSVRFAEILASTWGNCRAAARILEEGPEHVVAQGIFHDLETNASTTFETRRRIVDKKGRRYSADMITITCNAACAIALRQAVLKGIPKPFWDDVYEGARARAVNTASLPAARQAAVKAFQPYGVDQARILATLGLDALEKVGAEDIAKLRGLFTAMKDGELTAETAFPTGDKDAPADSSSQMTIEEFGMNQPKTNSRKPSPADVDSPAAAYELGRKAHGDHAKRTQWPAAWRDQPNIEAWLAGWDAADEDRKSAEQADDGKS